MSDALGKLEEYRAHRRERERQILSAINAGAVSVSEIREVVYGPIEDVLSLAAAASIEAHLAYIRARGDRLPEIQPDTPGD